MNFTKSITLIKSNNTFIFSQLRCVTTTEALKSGKVWRQSVGLPKLQTARGPLIDLPDYSFTDGRAIPLSVGQSKRVELQKKLATEIFDGLKYLSRAKSLSNEIYAKNSPQLLPLKSKVSKTNNV